ncbi:DUF1311 domain-containing protein [Dyella jejuensis]|uniref:DUF1311 domain-containing protein n=1 Tax=Dyella jejuensis TaxID=1432009 RepID=A0ABW8JJ33_9GAMM
MFSKKFLVLSVALFSSAVFAAGFNCDKSAVIAERLICSNAKLSALDVDLNKAYKSALESASSASKTTLIKEQRNWLAYARDSCEDVNCLKDAYTTRIALLRKNVEWIVNARPIPMAIDGQQRNVVFHRDPNEEVVFFNKKLSEEGGKRLIECHRLVSLPVGYANSDQTYGAYCTMISDKGRRNVIICADKFIGHFSFEDYENDKENDLNLIEFTNRKCFGG